MLLVLSVVDFCALGVGLTILRRVTKIVVETGKAIDRAVTENINSARDSAVDEFASAVKPALAQAATELIPLITDFLEDKIK